MNKIMDNKLNLIELLKDVPKGTKFYSPMTGELTFINIFRPSNDSCYVELLRPSGVNMFFDSRGRYFTDAPDGECLLFPSKDKRNWDDFKPPIPDKALVWCWNEDWKSVRSLRFYDAVNDSVFNTQGGRNYDNRLIGYDHYERFQGKEPEWVEEARNNLKG